MIRTLAAAAALAFASAAAAQEPAPNYPGQAQFRDLYQELVETDTTLSSGSCTAAAQKMAARLKAGGYGDADLQILAPPERPKDGA